MDTKSPRKIPVFPVLHLLRKSFYGKQSKESRG